MGITGWWPGQLVTLRTCWDILAPGPRQPSFMLDFIAFRERAGFPAKQSNTRNLEDVLLGEASQSQEGKCCLTPLRRNLSSRTPGNREGRVVAEGRGRPKQGAPVQQA